MPRIRHITSPSSSRPASAGNGEKDCRKVKITGRILNPEREQAGQKIEIHTTGVKVQQSCRHGIRLLGQSRLPALAHTWRHQRAASPVPARRVPGGGGGHWSGRSDRCRAARRTRPACTIGGSGNGGIAVAPVAFELCQDVERIGVQESIWPTLDGGPDLVEEFAYGVIVLLSPVQFGQGVQSGKFFLALTLQRHLSLTLV